MSTVPESVEPLIAADVARGVARLFLQAEMTPLPEVPLGNGRRADIMAIDARGCITIVEIKVSRADLLGDMKWPFYLDYCDRFFWAVPGGFDLTPFATKAFRPECCGLIVADRYDAAILREMLMGSKIIEGGGCGFNPKAPRYTVYPAGSNSPGALHFGVDLARPSDYIRRVMPNWEEPPIHQDLIVLDATVTAGKNTVVDKGFLMALRDPEVVALASRYGDPIDLLESFV